MFVAAEDFGPLAVVIFSDDGAGEERAGGGDRRRFWQAVNRQELLFACVREIAENKNFSARSEESFRGSLDVVGSGRGGRGSFGLRGGPGR